MSKRKLLIEIEANMYTCGKCHKLSINGMKAKCIQFGIKLDANFHRQIVLRSERCLEAEQKGGE